MTRSCSSPPPRAGASEAIDRDEDASGRAVTSRLVSISFIDCKLVELECKSMTGAEHGTTHAGNNAEGEKRAVGSLALHFLQRLGRRLADVLFLVLEGLA